MLIDLAKMAKTHKFGLVGSIFARFAMGGGLFKCYVMQWGGGEVVKIRKKKAL